MTVLVERFPGWVESVELLPASARFAALRQAAEGIGGTLEPAAALDLVTYAVGRDGGFIFEALCAAVSVYDPTFSAAPSDLEPHLVASAAVARALENDNLAASIVATAILSAEFAGLHAPVAELPQLARAAQARRFETLRERAPLPRIEFETLFKDMPSFVTDGWRASEAVDRLAGATKALAEQLDGILGGLAERFEARSDAADEELDVLWWAFGAQAASAVVNDPADGLLQAGRELADRHRSKAEIPTSSEILRRVLGPRGEQECVLADAVAAAGGLVELDETVPGPLFPILTSNTAWLALAGEADWVAAAARLGVDPTIRRPGYAIAAQTMRELLLVRANG
jgi:hypothetical protein